MQFIFTPYFHRKVNNFGWTMNKYLMRYIFNGFPAFIHRTSSSVENQENVPQRTGEDSVQIPRVEPVLEPGEEVSQEEPVLEAGEDSVQVPQVEPVLEPGIYNTLIL